MVCDEKRPTCRRCSRTSTTCTWSRDLRIIFHGASGQKTKQKAVSRDSPSPHQTTTSLSLEIAVSSSILDTGIASIRPHEGQVRSHPELFKDWASLGASNLVQQALRSNLELTLMHNYLTEVAPWFDAHTGIQYYSRVEVPRMLSCPPWRAAALALSAKNIMLREHRSLALEDETLPLHLYQFAVRLAINAMSGRFDKVGTLAGCVLLSVYEMMTVTYTDWRRHVQGCASIYTHNHWNGSTGGLVSGSFWDYARIGECLDSTDR